MLMYKSNFVFYFFENMATETKEYHNLLEQNFYAEKPSQKWVGDITYIYTIETGWTYNSL